MGKIFAQLTENHISFVNRQVIFFVGTAAAEGSVNISPKGLDSLRVIDETRLIWLNLTGSGNETAAHLLQNNRMTIMFCAFEGKPLILRVYGRAEMYHEGDAEWDEHIGLFPNFNGRRQLMDLKIERVQSSCGFAVPFMDFVGERDQLTKWSANKGREGIEEYWNQKNVTSIDGFSTDM